MTNLILPVFISFWSFHPVYGKCTGLNALAFAELDVHLDSAYYNLELHDVVLCAKLCIFSSLCQSFNFILNDHICQLNDQTKLSLPGNFGQQVGSIYSDIADWLNEIPSARACIYRPCSEAKLCIPFPGPSVEYTCKPIGCMPPLVTSDATKDPDMVLYPIGTELLVTCNSEYYWSSGIANVVTCLSDTSWSGDILQCKSCSDPPVVPHAGIDSIITSTFTIATYSCLCPLPYGQTLSGNPELSCTAEGSWAGSFSCEVDCYSDTNKYSGYDNHTINNVECQDWVMDFPHSHVFHDPATYPEGSDLAAGNYCRDPSYSGFLWCYTMSSLRWDKCGVPHCDTCT